MWIVVIIIFILNMLKEHPTIMVHKTLSSSLCNWSSFYCMPITWLYMYIIKLSFFLWKIAIVIHQETLYWRKEPHRHGEVNLFHLCGYTMIIYKCCFFQPCITCESLYLLLSSALHSHVSLYLHEALVRSRFYFIGRIQPLYVAF